MSTEDFDLDRRLESIKAAAIKFVRIPVKWATDSANKWARVGRASRRGKNIISEVAHFSQ
jgi:hypothetical protein